MALLRRFVYISIVCYQGVAGKSVSAVYDPGPRHICYAWDNTTNPPDYSECSQLEHFDQGCHYPNTGSSCYSWSFDSYGWEYPTDWQTTPGYNAAIAGGNGSLVSLTLSNKARGLTQDTGGGYCGLYEFDFSYIYLGYAFKKQSNGDPIYLNQYNGFAFQFDTTVNAPNCQAGKCQKQKSPCKNWRQYLTSDFIYYWENCTDPSCPVVKNALSIRHLNPGKDPANQWRVKGEGCRYQVDGPMVTPGKKSHVQMDLTSLLSKYGNKLCHGPKLPPKTWVESIEIVSSNVDSDTTFDVGNCEVEFKN